MTDKLFITDLDGTLLSSTGELTNETESIISNLLNKNINIAIATARTHVTCLDKIKNLNIVLPIITMNGAAIYDPIAKRYLKVYSIPFEDIWEIYEYAKSLGLCLLVHSIQDKIVVYYNEKIDERGKMFINSRKNLNGVEYVKSDPKQGINGVYLTISGNKERLMPLLDYSKAYKNLNGSFYRDVYDKGIYYLEIYNKNASKGYGALEIKKMTNSNELIVFGDNDNDISMFLVSDKSYAVKNCSENLKKYADEIIDFNNNNSVAKKIIELSKEK